MHIKVLGSAAGGGFPQWNCNCRNCKGVREGSIRARRRTQSSIAISDDGKHWILCNASPDIASQLAANPELHDADVLRGTAISAIILTDSQIDHTAGLLSLREGCPHAVCCTSEVRQDLTDSFPIFPMLSHWQGGLIHHLVEPGTAFGIHACPDLSITPLATLSNAPPYSRNRHHPLPGHNIALFIQDQRRGTTLLYAPGVGELSPDLLPYLEQADCLLIDGTLWEDQELALNGIHGHTSKEMGHLPLADAQGLIPLLSSLPAKRTILIHINNTNPILDEDSEERRLLTAHGIEVSHDGMSVTL